MAPEVGHLNESAVAKVARVRLLARVQPHVGLQVVISGEPLVAHLAGERFLARVSALVVLQDVLVAERPVANFAREDLKKGGNEACSMTTVFVLPDLLREHRSRHFVR